MNAKIAVRIIAAAAAVVLPISCFAAEMSWKYDEANATVSVSGYGMVNDATNFTSYIKTAKRIEFEKGVTKIEKNVFTNCGIVETVVLPDGFTSLGNSSFSFSKHLKTVNFPETLEYIGDEAFMDCPSLEIGKIPKNVSYIGANAFTECDLIKNFEIDEENPNYTAVDGVIFTKDKTELVMYPAGRNDESYQIPDGTVKISPKAFSYNSSLVSVRVPDTVSEIGNYAFYFCENLQDVSFGSGLKTIGNYAFYGSGIRSAILPFGIETLGADAFKNCEFLTVVDIPGTVSQIGDSIFYGTDDTLKIKGYGVSALNCANDAEKAFEETVRIIVNGRELNPDKSAYVENGCTMIPMRCIFEALGASVEWNDETQTAAAKRGGIECSFAIGGDVLYKNGKEIKLSAPAVLSDGRTLVHVRAIAEAFGEKVDWDGERGLVTVTAN
ncbi:leucine-rich repeat protein [Qingrenia yutianensis]|uniref:Leucine-rich repeat protein n=1 Tax=Qingrenia yutianensis TaxID=2763676 RepID=A0A926F5X0_9FIRM|nr:leucine-rich repeat protein [Qingrenia yutianensis]MBC8595301.1 leucine-rich repeat protein [Qingrenia yutianensis]